MKPDEAKQRRVAIEAVKAAMDAAVRARNVVVPDAEVLVAGIDAYFAGHRFNQSVRTHRFQPEPLEKDG